MNSEHEMDFENNFNRDNIINLNGVEYRLQRIIDATATNIHHIISRKEKEKFNVHDERNKMKINMRLHDSLNRFY